MKIFTYGGKCEWCQLPQIEKGFVELGHTITETIEEADIIYANNGWYDEILEKIEKTGALGKCVFNVLDVPKSIHPHFDENKLKRQIGGAHVITSISKFTKNELVKYTGFDSEIIHQPIMPVYRMWEERPENLDWKWRFLFAGRKYDPNKRVGIGYHALLLLGVESKEVAMIGHENIDWGTNFGLVKKANLNAFYNGADFVMCLGKFEGLNLPVIEAMATGSIPVICNDMTTRQELLPSDVFPEYDEVDPTPSSVAMFIAQFMQDNDAKQKFKNRLHAYYLAHHKEKFSGIAVASKILKLST